MRVSFLVPAYNEAATIGAVLEQVDALPSTSRSSSSTTARPTGHRRCSTAGATGRTSSSSARITAARAPRSAPRSPHADGDICVIQDADL